MSVTSCHWPAQKLCFLAHTFCHKRGEKCSVLIPSSHAARSSPVGSQRNLAEGFWARFPKCPLRCRWDLSGTTPMLLEWNAGNRLRPEGQRGHWASSGFYQGGWYMFLEFRPYWWELCYTQPTVSWLVTPLVVGSKLNSLTLVCPLSFLKNICLFYLFILRENMS